MIKISYREKFIKSIKEQFAGETEAYRRKEKAESLLFEYFGELVEELFDETEASDERLEIEYDSIKLNGTELGFDFVNGAIEVYTTVEGSEEKKIIDRLEDNGTAYISKQHNAELSDDLLDVYLKQLYEGNFKDK
jgi:hypothetical protein